MANITSIRLHAFIRQRQLCYYCGCVMWLRRPVRFAARHCLPEELVSLAKCTAEHLKPQCEGGSDEASNIVAACAYCNQRRHHVAEPLEPGRYREFVQERMKQGAW